MRRQNHAKWLFYIKTKAKVTFMLVYGVITYVILNGRYNIFTCSKYFWTTYGHVLIIFIIPHKMQTYRQTDTSTNLQFQIDSGATTTKKNESASTINNDLFDYSVRRLKSVSVSVPSISVNIKANVLSMIISISNICSQFIFLTVSWLIMLRSVLAHQRRWLISWKIFTDSCFLLKFIDLIVVGEYSILYIIHWMASLHISLCSIQINIYLRRTIRIINEARSSDFFSSLN